MRCQYRREVAGEVVRAGIICEWDGWLGYACCEALEFESAAALVKVLEADLSIVIVT